MIKNILRVLGVSREPAPTDSAVPVDGEPIEAAIAATEDSLRRLKLQKMEINRRAADALTARQKSESDAKARQKAEEAARREAEIAYIAAQEELEERNTIAALRKQADTLERKSIEKRRAKQEAGAGVASVIVPVSSVSAAPIAVPVTRNEGIPL